MNSNHNQGSDSSTATTIVTLLSTKDVFDQVYDRLVPGTVIIFDEYWNGPHWREDEWKAWQECCQEHNLKYEYQSLLY